MKIPRISTILKCLGVFIIALIVISFFKSSNNKHKTDSEPRVQQKVDTNDDSESSFSDKTQKDTHKDVKVKKYYDTSNLNLKRVPSTGYVRHLVKRILNVNSSKDLKSVEADFEIDKSAVKGLPSNKSNGFQYKYNYPGNYKNLSVALDYDNLSTNNVPYMVSFDVGNLPYYYSLTFDKNILTDVESMQ